MLGIDETSPAHAQIRLIRIGGILGGALLIAALAVDFSGANALKMPKLPTPSQMPTSFPTLPSGMAPTGLPSGLPTDLPSGLPTDLPSGLPSALPSDLPSSMPSLPNLPGSGS